MKNSASRIILIVLIIIFGAGFVVLMNHLFTTQPLIRDLFSGSSGEVFGEVAENSEASIARRNLSAAWVSMMIFSVITALQILALGIGFAVVSGIRHSQESAKLKLRRLDNAEIFFDVPLYVGLFGTVSAFLVMTFSPQSSRLIAYSSTLIGIIFSLLLRLALQYPLRQRLISGSDGNGGSGK